MQVRQQQVIGTYTTKDQRIETKNEIQRAHFHMGFDTYSTETKDSVIKIIDKLKQPVFGIKQNNDQKATDIEGELKINRYAMVYCNEVANDEFNFTDG